MKNIEEITHYNLSKNYAGKKHKISEKFSLAIPEDTGLIAMHYAALGYEAYCILYFRDPSNGVGLDSVHIKDENIGHLKKWLNDNCSKLEEMIE